MSVCPQSPNGSYHTEVAPRGAFLNPTGLWPWIIIYVIEFRTVVLDALDRFGCAYSLFQKPPFGG